MSILFIFTCPWCVLGKLGSRWYLERKMRREEDFRSKTREETSRRSRKEKELKKGRRKKKKEWRNLQLEPSRSPREAWRSPCLAISRKDCSSDLATAEGDWHLPCPTVSIDCFLFALDFLVFYIYVKLGIRKYTLIL